MELSKIQEYAKAINSVCCVHYNIDHEEEVVTSLVAIILDQICNRTETSVIQKPRLFTKAKIQLLGMEEPKEVPIISIGFKDEKLYSVMVKYPLDNNYYDYLTYYFDGRKLGEEKDVDVSEIFKGFSA